MTQANVVCIFQYLFFFSDFLNENIKGRIFGSSFIASHLFATAKVTIQFNKS